MHCNGTDSRGNRFNRISVGKPDKKGVNTSEILNKTQFLETYHLDTAENMYQVLRRMKSFN